MRNRTIVLNILLLAVVCTTSFVGLFLVTSNYTPKDLGPAAMTFWFVGVLIALASLFTLLDYLWKLRKDDNRMQPRKIIISSMRTGFLLGFTGSVLLALSSLRSLTMRDVILFILTVLLIELYFRTRKAKT